jgi:hypothetical protein
LASGTKTTLTQALTNKGTEITNQWIELQGQGSRRMTAAEKQSAVRKSQEFIEALKSACASGDMESIDGPAWEPIRAIQRGLLAH